MTRSATPTAALSAGAALADLVERLTAEVQAGRSVDEAAVLAAHPEHADELRRLLPAMREGRQVQEQTLALLREGRQVHPSDFFLNYALAYVLSKTSPVEAVRYYTAAQALPPDCVAVLINLGCALDAQGKWAEAEAAYREALRLKPDFSKAYNNLGNALSEQGKLTEAEAAYREAIRLKPDYPRAHRNLGRLLRQKELDAKLPRVLKGEAQPADVAERLGLAEICQQPDKALYTAAVPAPRRSRPPRSRRSGST
jgi:tetratricopeptide (TPR) repeat protein